MFSEIWKFLKNPVSYYRAKKRLQELRKRDPFIYK